MSYSEQKKITHILLIILAFLLSLCIAVDSANAQSDSEYGTSHTLNIGSEGDEQRQDPEQKDPEQKDPERQEIRLCVKRATANTITLKWSKVSGASKYYIYRSNKSKSKLKKYKTFSALKRTYKDKKVSPKKKYYYIIATVSKEGKQARSNYIVKPKIRGNFKRGTVYGPYLSQKQRKQLKNILANIVCKYQTEQLSQKDRIFFAHDYIAYKTTYHSSGSQVASALGPLKYGKAHCQGYSRAFVALTAAMGVKSKYIHASSSASNPAHQWNMVKLKGKWYLIDVQCNDSSNFDAVFLMGRDHLKGFFKKAYRYNKKGKPKLTKKSYPARDYCFQFE